MIATYVVRPIKAYMCSVNSISYLVNIYMNNKKGNKNEICKAVLNSHLNFICR